MKQLTRTESLEEVIKKSTFIAMVGVCETVEEAKQFLAEHSQDNVTHNCWAYKIGNIYRFNDDGEPSGTAGKPILNAIEGQGFDNTVALVIRHYGGIKLGTGGLMRAYGGVVSRCLQTADFQPILKHVNTLFLVNFADVQAIHNLVKKSQAEILSEDYIAEGVKIEVKLLEERKTQFCQHAENMLKGQITFLNQ